MYVCEVRNPYPFKQLAHSVPLLFGRIGPACMCQAAIVRPRAKVAAPMLRTMTLSREQLQSRARNGYLVFPAVFRQHEIATLRAEANAILELIINS